MIGFKKVALVAALGLGTAGAAMAADLPARVAAPAPAPIFVAANWTGFYVGANIGYGGWGDDKVGIQLATPLPLGWRNVGSLAPSGVFGGLQAGYNWQRGSLVYGLEMDIQYSGMKESFATAGLVASDSPAGSLGAFAGSHRVNWFGSVRPRIGFLVSPSTLVYATGGLGVMGGKYRVTGVDAGLNNFTLSSNSTRIGWVIGAGLEHKFNPNWSVKAEYQYHQYGSKALTNPILTPAGVPVPGTRARTLATPNFHTVRIGLNYHFVTGGGAVVAKY